MSWRISIRRISEIAGYVVFDAAVVAFATAAAYVLRFDGRPPAAYVQHAGLFTLASAAWYVLIFAVLGLYGYVWRFAGATVYVRLGLGATLALVLNGIMVLVLRGQGIALIPRSIPVIQWAIVLIGAALWRSSGRFSEVTAAMGHGSGGKRVLIVGAGNAGMLLLRDIQAQPDLGLRVEGLLDDDPGKLGRHVGSSYVIGRTDELVHVVAQRGIEEVLIAVPSEGAGFRKRILEQCATAGVKARIVQSPTSPVRVATLGGVHIEDLLGRDPIVFDMSGMSESFGGKHVVVTGAAGSIGSELCRQVIALGPRRLYLVDVDESRLYELFTELESMHPGICEMCLVDVRVRSRVLEFVRTARPDIVLHAAAYKHVPVMELWPFEAFEANVCGSRNVIDACVEAHVPAFVFISTDKAVEPRNIMGLTKAIAEQYASHMRRKGLHSSAVRFGNVLGSRGSVIPLFEAQLSRGGPLRVTHAEATRYFMTIPEAARLVLQAHSISDGDEVFVLDMGEPVKIIDLARNIVAVTNAKVGIEITGLRPGEKLHERLAAQDVALVPTDSPGILRLSDVPDLPENFDITFSQLCEAATRRDMTGIREAVHGLLDVDLEWFDEFARRFEASANSEAAVDESGPERHASAIDLPGPNLGASSAT